MKKLLVICLAFLMVVLAGCGGGVGSSTTTIIPDPNSNLNPDLNPVPTQSEGTKTAPVVLSVETPHNGGVGGLDSLFSSYYTFHTNSAGGYIISVENIHSDFSFMVFSDNGYTHSVGSFCNETWGAGDEKCIFTLSGSTGYSGLYHNAAFTSSSPYSCGPGTSLACDLQENLTAGAVYYLTVSEWSHVDATYDIKLFRLDDAAGCTAGGTCTTFQGLSGLPAGFTTSAGSSAPWVIDSSTAGDYALKSGNIIDNQTSCVETTAK